MYAYVCIVWNIYISINQRTNPYTHMHKVQKIFFKTELAPNSCNRQKNFSVKIQYLWRILLYQLRAPLHVKFCPRVNFSISARVEKKNGVILESQPGAKRIFFYFMSSWGESIFANIWCIIYKNLLRKKHDQDEKMLILKRLK